MEPDAKLFRQHIRQFNAAFAFTSMCAKRDDRLSSSQASRSYQICGSSVHLQGPLAGMLAEKFRIRLHGRDKASDVLRRWFGEIGNVTDNTASLATHFQFIVATTGDLSFPE
ncbi:hypothetical protein N7461_001077 [Penicillium sp. DV-2018c]|nr:hypothetical protein N7461_001077 [Penicillium sp. DV-2018c]